jgi:hypothetical protein
MSNRLKIVKVGDGICQVLFALLVGIAAVSAMMFLALAISEGHLAYAIITLITFGAWFVGIVLAFFLVFALTEIAINSAKLVQLMSGPV